MTTVAVRFKYPKLILHNFDDGALLLLARVMGSWERTQVDKTWACVLHDNPKRGFFVRKNKSGSISIWCTING